MFDTVKLNDVFKPGGQPSITYVSRDNHKIEDSLRKAISQPNIFVALTGTTKSGKTVLCRNVLDEFPYIWIEGGQVKSEIDLWEKVCYELNYPIEVRNKMTDGGQVNASASAGVEAGIPGNKASFMMTLGGSKLSSVDAERTYRIDSMHTAIEHLTRHSLCLVIDDFHYIPDKDRAACVRTLKGAVFNGLKVVLLSTPHRAFEAIKAEAEVTGRFRHVTVPIWQLNDLKKIAEVGFAALNVSCPAQISNVFAREAQESPLLMQQFCWTICYDSKIEEKKFLQQKIDSNFSVENILNEIAKDSGFPIYEKLARGPQTRTDRIKRPLIDGGAADIYSAILLAIAVTGPKERLSYDEIRSSLSAVLADKVPQKLEVSNALNHLSTIDQKENKGERAIDWNGESLILVLTDPYFRFYLRWEIARNYEKGEESKLF